MKEELEILKRLQNEVQLNQRHVTVQELSHNSNLSNVHMKVHFV